MWANQILTRVYKRIPTTHAVRTVFRYCAADRVLLRASRNPATFISFRSSGAAYLGALKTYRVPIKCDRSDIPVKGMHAFKTVPFRYPTDVSVLPATT